MDALQAWLQRQIDEHLVEPNSGLGEAINYLLKRWDKFTLFLRQAGAPLDNNPCELCGANPFDYLTELQRHARELAANPACWMPWNYRQTLAVEPSTNRRA